jgi:hypothetical protein
MSTLSTGDWLNPESYGPATLRLAAFPDIVDMSDSPRSSRQR